MPTEWMRPTRSTESDSTRASSYSYAMARPPFSARNTYLTRVLYVIASRQSTNPFLIGAITLKSEVPAMPPVLIVKSRRMSLSPPGGNGRPLVAPQPKMQSIRAYIKSTIWPITSRAFCRRVTAFDPSLGRTVPARRFQPVSRFTLLFQRRSIYELAHNPETFLRGTQHEE